MSRLGIEMFDAQGNILPMSGIVTELQDGLAGMTSEQKASTLAIIFGQEAMSGMMTLVEAGPDKVDALSTSFENSAGAADEMARTMQDNAAGAIDEMMGALETAGIEITQALAPIIRDLAGDVTELVGRFSELDDETQQNIIKWAAFAMAAGPVLSILGNITSGVGTLSSGMGTLVQWFGKVTTPKTVGGMTTALSTIGGGATTTAAQVGGLTTMIGGLPVVLGVVGAALLGWTAWEAWGEDAWNAAQRTKEWGVDVGETVGNTLTEIKGLNDGATGQFNLMAQGLDVNANSMADNFTDLGNVIEDSLIKKIQGLDELMKNIPSTVSDTLNDLIEEEKAEAETALEIVQQNNERIKKIRDNASKHNRDLSISEAKQLQDLAKESSEAYVRTLDLSANEQQLVLQAMTGDVSSATKEQATLWATSLAEQRQEAQNHAKLSRNEQEKYLEDMGYNLEGEFAQKYLKAWDDINGTTIQGFDQQLAAIAEKYPEIMNEIFLANGQVIDATSETGTAMIAENERIIKNAGILSNQLADTAEKNAKQLAWIAEEGSLGADTWNDIVLDEKTGEIKTNVREEVIKAGEDSVKWNSMRFQLHNANLDSNAKSIIGESAIVNGWWDGMSWEEKAIILKDEFSQNTYKALEESGKWNEMTIEEKTAIMYSNTPEKMTETLAYLGLWDEFEPDIKKVNADNAGFIQSIMDSEEKMNYWRSIPDETKEMLGENYDLLTTIFHSEEAYNNFKALSDEEKQFLGENSDLMSAVLQSKESYNNWVSMPDEQKKLLANNKDLMAKVFSSQEAYEEWMRLPATEKRLRATSNVPGVAADSKGALASVPNLKATQILARTNAWETARSAQRAINSVNGKTVTVLTQFKTSGSPAGAGIGKEKGTNYHLGGPMIVNDQKGPTYKELITYPNGKSFVPEGRNVFIPNAPKGTKVLKAALTKPLIPRYEKGIGYDERSIRSANAQPALSINIEIKDPVVREEQDINKISNAVVEKITLNTQLKNLFNKGRGGAYAGA